MTDYGGGWDEDGPQQRQLRWALLCAVGVGPVLVSLLTWILWEVVR